MSARPVSGDLKKPRGFRFQIHLNYDDRILSDLFEALESRGANCMHLGPVEPDWYLVYIPHGLRWIPFVKTARDCPSVKSVKGTGEFYVYECEPEG